MSSMRTCLELGKVREGESHLQSLSVQKLSRSIQVLNEKLKVLTSCKSSLSQPFLYFAASLVVVVGFFFLQPFRLWAHYLVSCVPTKQTNDNPLTNSLFK